MRSRSSAMAEPALRPVPAERSDKPEAPPRPPSDLRARISAAKTLRFDRKLWLRRGLYGLLPLALLIGGIWDVTGGVVMSTHNGYVDAETVGISTDVAVIVQEVNVHENQ